MLEEFNIPETSQMLPPLLQLCTIPSSITNRVGDFPSQKAAGRQQATSQWPWGGTSSDWNV